MSVINIGKPNLKRLTREGLSVVDMHFHTKFSDTYTKVPTIIKKAKKLGIGVGITDHNLVKGASLATRSSDGTLVLPGVEVSCYEGPHILVYFNHEKDLTDFYIRHIRDFREKNPYTSTKIKVETLLENAEKYNCLVSAAHPYNPTYCGLCTVIDWKHVDASVLDRIPAIEAINGANSEVMNVKAIRLIKEKDKMFTGGSDGHSITSLGEVVTVAEGETPEQFLESIRKKKNRVYGQSHGLVSMILSTMNSLTFHMQYLLPNLRLRAQRTSDLTVKHNVKPIIDSTVTNLRETPKKVSEQTKKFGKLIRK